MARARNAAALLTSEDDELREIESWYRDMLERTLPPADLQWEPVKLGPTWQWDDKAGWWLPQATLGWQFMAWCGRWLQGKKGPWQFTPEQARFLLWFFALDQSGQFLYHSAVLQRLKGWGKDPVAGTLGIGHLCGPTLFDHWDGDRPIGRDNPNAWVQMVAVSQQQTQNTMKLFPSLISAEARKRYGIQVGKLNVWAMGDTRQIEAVTASVMAIEGGRPTLIVRNETQNWNGSNGGHDMAGAIEGNAAKSAKDSPARMLDICNAYRPGEDSVGQRAREAYEQTVGDRAAFEDFGVMYDSLEAPPEAPLTLEAAPSVVASVRGDAVWLDAEGRIKKSIANPQNSPSESRRKWYNQITAAEDAWTEPGEWDPLQAPDTEVEQGDEVVLFLDCSKSDDATALVGCRMADGHVFTLNMWQRPPGKRGDGWLAPREAVDAAVQSAFDRYRVVGFFGDPSHVLDDETMDRYWDPLFNEWHLRYRHQLRVWASGTKGGKGSAVMYDMSARDNARDFASAVAFTLEEIKSAAFTHDADPRLRRHVLNARRYPVQGYVSISKDHRESKNKIDLAVCMVGARMVRRLVLNNRPQKKGRGQIW
ncbi:terminase [Curtobacterium sp. MCBD17_003]|uniref:terminase n=1 Tax=Curtobacterium sp. MCBD17_003 TaxID=2175667 RepID=UPI000DA80EF1|nr:terminase [Curtobacterium sp. MCBD17_003]WIE54220.1 terminase [Curtobacterium sp. MCBD17_003]